MLVLTESVAAALAATLEELKVIMDEFKANYKVNQKLMKATLEANRKSMMDDLYRTKLNKSTSVGTGQQTTATSVAATASSPQDRVVQSSASAPTQLTPSSLPSDTPSDTTASGDRELGLDSASAPLTLDPNSVRVESVTTEEKTSTTEENVTSMSSKVTQSLPSLIMPASSQVVTEASPAVSTPLLANQPATASGVIVVETTATAASTVAQAGATQAQSTGSQPSVPESVASGNTNTGVTTINVILTTGSMVNPIPVAAPPMTDQSTHPPSEPLVPTAVPPTVPPTVRNFGASPTSTFHPVAASIFAQAPTSSTFPFSGAGPPYAELPLDGGGSYVPHDIRDGCQHGTNDWTTRSSRHPDGSNQITPVGHFLLEEGDGKHPGHMDPGERHGRWMDVTENIDGRHEDGEEEEMMNGHRRPGRPPEGLVQGFWMDMDSWRRMIMDSRRRMINSTTRPVD